MRALGDLPSEVKLAIYQLIPIEDRSKAAADIMAIAVGSTKPGQHIAQFINGQQRLQSADELEAGGGGVGDGGEGGGDMDGMDDSAEGDDDTARNEKEAVLSMVVAKGGEVVLDKGEEYEEEEEEEELSPTTYGRGDPRNRKSISDKQRAAAKKDEALSRAASMPVRGGQHDSLADLRGIAPGQGAIHAKRPPSARGVGGKKVATKAQVKTFQGFIGERLGRMPAEQCEQVCRVVEMMHQSYSSG